MKIILLILTLLVSFALSAPLPYCNTDCLLQLIDRIPNAFEKTTEPALLSLKEVSTTAKEITVIQSVTRSDDHKESTLLGDYMANYNIAATHLKTSDNDQITITEASFYEHKHQIKYDINDQSESSELLTMTRTATATLYNDPTHIAEMTYFRKHNYGHYSSTTRNDDATSGTRTIPLTTIDPASTSRNYRTTFADKTVASHITFDSAAASSRTDEPTTPPTFSSALTTRDYFSERNDRTATRTKNFYNTISLLSAIRNYRATPTDKIDMPTALQDTLSSASTGKVTDPFSFLLRPTATTITDDQVFLKIASYPTMSPVSSNQLSGSSLTNYTVLTGANSFTQPSRNLSALISATTEKAAKFNIFANEIVTNLKDRVYAIIHKLYNALKSIGEPTIAHNTTLIHDSFRMSGSSTSLNQHLTPVPIFFNQRFYDDTTELSSVIEPYFNEPDSSLVSSSTQIAEEISVSIAVVDSIEHLSDFHEAKVYDPAPTYSEKDDYMNEDDSWKNPELASYYDKQPSGFTKIQTGILASCGVLAVAGIAIGIFVWRNRVYDLNSVPNKKQDEAFPGLRLFFNDSNSDSLIIDMEQEASQDGPDLNIGMIEDLVMNEYARARKTHEPAILNVPEGDSDHDKGGVTLSASVLKLFGVEKTQEIDLEEGNFVSPLDLPPTQFVPFLNESPIKLISRAEYMENMAYCQTEDHYHC